jgi:cytochrome c oxidase assembly factor CtaG
MHSIYSYWHFDPVLILFIAILCFLYLYIIQFNIRKQSLFFFAGIFVIVICVASPLHFLGKNYLFSAHMIAHVLLLLIAAPLFVAGIPRENKFRKFFLILSTNKIKIHILCWFTGVGIMWFWHIPSVFNSVMAAHSMAFMQVQWLSLLFGGITFCWPIINPYRQYRLASLSAVLYLSLACVFCTILGLMITFAPLGMYLPYLHLPASGGFANLIRNRWNISASIDQQAAGLIMWVPCCLIYLTASMAILVKWYNQKPYEVRDAIIIKN